MITFFAALALLILGFIFYSAIIERLLPPDNRKTPAITMNDGVDYIPMPVWKSFLIQLLNIAGLGPIFGALAGALWGPIVYFWIVFGTIFAGAVHDYFSGMISCRHNGATIAEVTGIYLGDTMKNVMRVLSILLLISVSVSFSAGPAGLLAMLTRGTVFSATFWFAVVVFYYFVATFCPIDKIIGRLYPVFGAALIFMCLGIGVGVLTQGYEIPEIWNNFANLHPNHLPVWPLMFVSVACGAISGFHSTQSPLIARCIQNEFQGRKIFYGAMVCEGVIALIWATAGVSVYGDVQGLFAQTQAVSGQAELVYNICVKVLGGYGAALALLGVIVCPITSADTALRSARLVFADWFHIDQGPIKNRLVIAVPLIAVVIAFSFVDFSIVWRYTSWFNQTLAMVVLWVIAVFLVKNKKSCLYAAIPAVFMSLVVSAYFVSAPECLGPVVSRIMSGGQALKGADMIHAALPAGRIFAVLFASVCTTKFIKFKKNWEKNNNKQ